MPFMKVALPCTSITINGVAKVPDVNREISVTQDEATGLWPIIHQPRFIIADLATGLTTIHLRNIIGGVTLNGVAYVPDGNGFITGVPAAVATQFLHRLKGRPLTFSRP